MTTTTSGSGTDCATNIVNSTATTRGAAPPTCGLRLGLASEQGGFDEVVRATEAAATDLGLDVCRVATADDEARVDLLIAAGFPHYYPDLLRRPRRARRILWYGEPLPTPGRGAAAAMLQGLPVPRLIDVATRLLPPLGRARRLGRLRARALTERLYRQNLGELRRIAPRFDELAVTSRQRVEACRAAGLAARVVPYGYHPLTTGPLADPDPRDRDVPVLLLGSELRAGTRRSAVIAAVERALPASVPLRAIGEGLYGEERARMLRRTRVVLDVHRVPGNFTGLRVVMAAAAGAVLVTEPFEGPTPCVPGVHYVAAPADRLAEAVCGVLADPAAARRMAEAAQALLRGELAMAACLRRLMGAPA